MNVEIEPLQQLVLWRLAVAEEGGEFLKNIEANLPPAKRKALVREGLVEERKQKTPDTGRPASYLELTDKGWSWCQNHLTDELKTRSLMSTPILQRLLCLLHDYFRNQEQTVSLAQFIHQARPPQPGANEPTDEDTGVDSTEAPEASGEKIAEGTTSPDAAEPDPEPSSAETSPAETSSVDREPSAIDDQLENSIAAACREIANGRENVRVRLAELRGRMHNVDRNALDQKLLAMERDGKLSLYRLDNPQEIGPSDRDAALRTPAGSERHIVYFGGRGS